jgi:excinuclease UvrABC nuclease subunit
VSRGPRKVVNARALQCAIDNAKQIANERPLAHIVGADIVGVPKTSVDGTAVKELASILSLEKDPERIECYDISHSQGDVAVGSRVVSINGRPAPHLYQKFEILFSFSQKLIEYIQTGLSVYPLRRQDS